MDTLVVISCPDRWQTTLSVSRAVHGGPESLCRKLQTQRQDARVSVGPWIVDGALTDVVHVVVSHDSGRDT